MPEMTPQERVALIRDGHNQRAMAGYPSRHLGKSFMFLTAVVLIIASIILWNGRSTPSSPHGVYDRPLIRDVNVSLTVGGHYDLNQTGPGIGASNATTATFNVTSAGLKFSLAARAHEGSLPGEGNDPCRLNLTTARDAGAVIPWRLMLRQHTSEWCVKSTRTGKTPIDTYLVLTPSSDRQHLNARVQTFVGE